MNFSKIYQNTVLTCILICLVVLIFQNQSLYQNQNTVANKATILQANPDFNVVLADYSNTHLSPNNFVLVPLNKNGTIDVNVREVSDVIDVNIEDISTYDKLNVHLKSTDSYSLRNAGPLEVEID